MYTETRMERAINLLSTISEKSIPYFTFKGKSFFAKPCNIYDGDTFSIIFEYGNEIMKYKCRAMGYDTAEMKPRLNVENREQIIEKAYAAKNRFTELLQKHPSGLVKVECLEFDKYGRILVNVWNMVDTKSLNEIMIEEGHGKPYSGGTKEDW